MNYSHRKGSTIAVLLIVFFAFVVFHSQVHAQNRLQIKFENISVRDGLSQNTPNCIMQDSKGFLWVGTEDGLNKYTGYEFTIYKHDISDSYSISNSKITCMKEDKEGNLWIGTNGGGLNKYNRQTDNFRHFAVEAKDTSPDPGDYIRCLEVLKNGDLWIGSDEGLFVLPFRSDKFIYPASSDKKVKVANGNSIKAIHADIYENIWIGTENGIICLNRSLEQIAQYSHIPDNLFSLPPGEITCFFSDSKNNLWVGTNQGAVRKNSGSELFSRLDPEAAASSYRIKAFLEDETGCIWIATFGGGLDIYIPGQDRIISHTYDFNNPYSLSHNEVSSLCMDRSGIIWAGTYGLDKYNPHKEKFRLYDYIHSATENLSFKSIYSIIQDTQGVLWIGSKTDGVHVFDRDHGRYFRIKHIPGNPNSLSSDKVRVIRENPAGTIWIGTDDAGLNKILLDENRRPYKFIHYNCNPVDPTTLSSDLIYSLYFDTNGYLWIGTDNGLNRMDIGSGTIRRYMPDNGNPSSLSNTTAYYIYGDASGTMWIATDLGINQYVPETDGFIHYVHDDKNPNSVIINEILTFYESRSGLIWIGTFAGGVDSYDKKLKRFTHYNQFKELSNAVVYAIFEDENFNLWMSTNVGIIQFNPKTNYIKQYTSEDGLQSNEFNGGAYYRNSQGEIFFGGYFGFNSFFPEKIKLDTVVPKIVLTDLQVKNVSVRPGNKSPVKTDIAVADEIVLHHKENNFSIHFAALHFANPLRNQYRYKLEGFDKEWIEAGSKRFAYYTNLPYRKYRFRVQAANSDGVWNEKGISVLIRIKPPLWKTIWFRLFSVLFILGAIYYALKNRMKQDQKQKEKLKELVKESTHELEVAREKLDKQREEIVIQKQELKRRERDQEELLWFNKGISIFSELIHHHKESLKELCKEIIVQLTEYIEAQQGVVYLTNEEDEQQIVLEMAAHHALNIERLNHAFLPGEGYVGTCYKDKAFIEIDDLPAGYAVMRSGLGQENLKHLLLAPMKMNELVVGVVEIASFKKIKGYRVAFVEKICETLASTVATENASTKLKRLISQTQQQAEELRVREEELRQNLEEMKATQEESSRREDELIKYAEEAASREELLGQRIEELESQLKKNNH